MTEENIKKSVKVVVLGDIGRSPRMQYHALSLANNGFKVNIIGYQESIPLREILDHDDITITALKPLLFNKGPRIVQYVFKAFWQAVSLLLTLFVTGKCNYVLCQNPPAIPTLPICRFYCLVSRTKFVIDWHNYAFSIMALSLPLEHPLLKISRFIEMFFGQSSNHNLCVTYAMKEDLITNWNIVAKVLYDKPPRIFHPISVEEKHEWFARISREYPEFGVQGKDQLSTASEATTKTAFTEVIDGKVEARPDRPGLLFSSTSWTPDEDFGVLMEALQVYETTYSLTNRLPKLICVITGKGPMKQHYINLMSAKKWKNVKVVTPWLKAADYPLMVASADLGVSLHTSSSGLDLPMKVVDMFGAGLPVCAYDFKCVGELVLNGINSYTFKGTDVLAKQIVAWFEGFPYNEIQNRTAERFRTELMKFQESRWEDNWNTRAKEIFVS